MADLPERENHDPDIEGRYTRVILCWWTYTAREVTERDRTLAALTDTLV